MPYKDPKVKKEKHAEYSATHYQENKVKVKARAAALKRQKRREWYAFKATFACIHCGFNHPAALDFHHVDRTNYRSVNKLAQAGNYKAARDEIKKCVCLCANCHRIHHHEERNIAKSKRKAKKKKTPSLLNRGLNEGVQHSNKEPRPKRRSKKP